MGVCLENACFKYGKNQKKTIHIDLNNKEKIKEYNPIENFYNEEKQIYIDESESTKKNITDQNIINQNQLNNINNNIINYKIQSRFKSEKMKYSHNGHLSNNIININNYYQNNTKDKDNFEKKIHFTNFFENKNNISGISITNSK